ncbi:hypothetical protein RB595_004232 [Gaeumannomyces hyphopodioides]
MRQRDNVAYFYCTNADTIRITNAVGDLEKDAVVTRIFRGLLGRLAMSPDRRRVAEEIEVAFDRSLQPGALGRVPLALRDAQDLLVRIINTRRDTTIIIDGLDELSDYGHLLRALKDIDDKVDAGRLRLLFASRGVVPVTQYFPSTQIVVTGEKGSMDDMHSFVDGRVQRFKELYPQDRGPLSEVLDDIVKTLPKKVEGMFTLAGLFLEQILDHRKSPSEIRSNWESIKQEEFRQLPVELVLRYDDAYDRSLPSGSPNERAVVHRAAQRALLWVLGAEQKLGREEYLALQKGEADEAPAQKTREVCENFLRLPDQGEIAVPHSSILDYISLKVTGQVKIFIDFTKREDYSDAGHEAILTEAKAAATSMAREQVARDCLKLILGGGGPSSDAEEARRPLFKYACQHWIKHLDAAIDSGTGAEGLLKLATSLFYPANANALSGWAEAYRSIQNDRVPRQARSLKSPDPLYCAVLTGRTDIVRFVLDNRPRSLWTGGPLGQALQLACYLGQESIAREILCQVDVDKADDVFGTPLHAAIAGHRREVVDLLVNECNADLNAPSTAFGNAIQMALALDDHELLESLVTHGAQYNAADRRGRIWGNVWRQIQDSEWRILVRRRRLRGWTGRLGLSESPMTGELEFPPSIDWKLRLLNDCIVCQRTISKNIRRAEAASTPAPKATSKSLADALSASSGHFPAADSGIAGFIPKVAMWVFLLHQQVNLRGYQGTTIYDVVYPHETFIRDYGDTVQYLDLDEVLTELFSVAIRAVLSLANRAPLWALGRMLDVSLLKELDTKAKGLEASAKEIAATNRLLTMHNERTMVALNQMASDMAEIKQQIAVLAQTILVLQQRSDLDSRRNQ